MATDKSEPKVGAILKVAVASIAILVVIRVAMVSYFDNVQAQIRADQALEAVRPELNMVNATAKTSLEQGPMPLDKAMQALATTSMNRQGMQGVEPKESHDMSSVTVCWQKMGCDGGGLILPTDADAGAGQAMAGDGGAGIDGSAGGDAGPAAAMDAGVKAAKPDAGGAPRPAPRPGPPNQPERHP